VSIDPNLAAASAVLGLMAIGLYALLTVRNVIKLLIGLQILAKAAILAMVLAGRVSGQPALGQSLAITIIVADTVVAIVGLALAVQIRQRIGTLDIRALARLHG
jgi:NADH:ubiquinone oxidoreductase subunit K